jgi:hypothetical protein
MRRIQEAVTNLEKQGEEVLHRIYTRVLATEKLEKSMQIIEINKVLAEENGQLEQITTELKELLVQMAKYTGNLDLEKETLTKLNKALGEV